MSLPKKIAAIAAPIAGVALLVALPASAQTDSKASGAAAPKAEANFASSASAGASHAGAMGMSSGTSSTMAPSSGAAMARPSTKVQTAGTQNGSSQAKLADKVSNDVK